MKRGFLWKAWHYAHAIEGRLFQLLEWSSLRAAGVPISDRVRTEIWRSPGSSEDWVQLARFLSPASAVYLIDVGANVGDFTERAMLEYPGLQAVCFEPVSANFLQLEAKFGRNSAITLYQFAASDETTSATIFTGRSDTLFSLETYTAEGNSAYKIEDGSYQQTETIECRRLDSFTFPQESRRILLKLDVQGHEEKALEGAAGILPQVDVAIIECTFANQYEGLPPSFAGVVKRMAAAGLFPIVFQDYGRDASNYAFERDVIFVRQPLLSNIWFANYN